MSCESQSRSITAAARTIVGALTLLGWIAATAAQAAESAVGKPAPQGIAERAALNLVSQSQLIARGRRIGTVVVYDDPATRRSADYLEIYDNGGGIVAIVWFDEFGIQRTVIDRAIVEGGDELEGVLVAVLDGESI